MGVKDILTHSFVKDCPPSSASFCAFPRRRSRKKPWEERDDERLKRPDGKWEARRKRRPPTIRPTGVNEDERIRRGSTERKGGGGTKAQKDVAVMKENQTWLSYIAKEQREPGRWNGNKIYWQNEKKVGRGGCEACVTVGCRQAPGFQASLIVFVPLEVRWGLEAQQEVEQPSKLLVRTITGVRASPGIRTALEQRLVQKSREDSRRELKDGH